MTEIRVDFRQKIKAMKPLHGFNNCARQVDYGEILPDFLRLRPPVVRLHDTAYPYGAGHYVDVHNIFPDFSADPDDPAAYDFALTDLYIKPLCENGIDVMYRLGTTIEHAPKKYHIFAPADPEKWAAVCEHIVRHYRAGWADGFSFSNMKYWEIWNEPDGLDPQIEPYGPPNWIGTAQAYYRLYAHTAKYLKQRHPEILVGGYSSCYILGRNEGGKWTQGDTRFFTDFLSFVKETDAPLDFFTWHGYLGNQGTKKIDREFGFVDRTLNDYGFFDTLRVDAEWNCCICDVDTPNFRDQFYINMRNEKGASHIAAALYEMQRCGVDLALFYDAQLWKEYGPLFHVPELTKTKTYRAFEQFLRLFEAGGECFSTQDGDVYALAVGGTENILALANTSAAEQKVQLRVSGGGLPVRFRLCDGRHDLSELPLPELAAPLVLPPYSFCDVTFDRQPRAEGTHL